VVLSANLVVPFIACCNPANCINSTGVSKCLQDCWTGWSTEVPSSPYDSVFGIEVTTSDSNVEHSGSNIGAFFIYSSPPAQVWELFLNGLVELSSVP